MPHDRSPVAYFFIYSAPAAFSLARRAKKAGKCGKIRKNERK
jgi:hypothetical protein